MLETILHYISLPGLFFSLVGAIVTLLRLYLDWPHIMSQRQATLANKDKERVMASDHSNNGTSLSSNIDIPYAKIGMSLLFLFLSVYFTYIIGRHSSVGAQGPQGIQGERGIQGLQGIPGPKGEPGPSAMVDPSLQIAMTTLLKLRLLEKHRALIAPHVRAYEDGCSQKLEALKNGTTYTPSVILPEYGSIGWRRFATPVTEYVEDVAQHVAKIDFSEEIIFKRHPNYDADRAYSVPGDDAINDKRRQDDYKKLYDECETSKGIISKLMSRYDGSIANVNRLIDEETETIK